VSEVGAWMDETAKQIRLLAQGAVTTSSGTYKYKTMIIDLTGKWDNFSNLESDDGNDVISGTFRARYNGTCATFGQVIVVNKIATLA